jgi:hypothetical protein
MMREINQEALDSIFGAGPSNSGGSTSTGDPKDTTGPYDPIGDNNTQNGWLS